MVAEDNAALRDYLVGVLRAEGYEVAEASTADDLLNTLTMSLHTDLGSAEFDLVIAEDRLVGPGAPVPGNSGTRASVPPFVLIGTDSRRRSAATLLGTNAVDMFDKPLDMDSLRDAVHRIANNVVDSRQATNAQERN